jgi:hypothetical protein
MEQYLGAVVGKHRVLARTLFHDCSMQLARGGPAVETQRRVGEGGKPLGNQGGKGDGRE